MMDDCPEFMKHPANRIATTKKAYDAVEGYLVRQETSFNRENDFCKNYTRSYSFSPVAFQIIRRISMAICRSVESSVLSSRTMRSFSRGIR